jgi:hypothetical protein
MGFLAPEEGDRTMPDLNTKRILVTQSNDFMGPAICAFLASQGAENGRERGAIDAMVVNGDRKFTTDALRIVDKG